MQKVAVITGTSSGIGLVTAVELASAGFKVIATMRDLARKERLLMRAAEAGVSDKIILRQLDITAFDTLDGFASGVAREFGSVDVLVNNAGYALGGFAEDIALEELRSQFDTNFFGHVAMTKAVLPIMRKQGSGHIIMVSSISGRVAAPVTSSYAASKHALEGWSESLRIETRALGIRVVLIEPGAFESDIWEKNVRIGKAALLPTSENRERARRYSSRLKERLRKGDPRDVARLIVRVANDPSPRLRYLIGRDAPFMYFSKLLMPWKIWERMVAHATHID